MILPVVAYGAKILEQPCLPADLNDPELPVLIADMWDSLDAAAGCGLAAPQVNRALRLFIVDSLSAYELMDEEERSLYFEGDEGIKEVFINPELLYVSFDLLWTDDEGCLSIPGLSAAVKRPWAITIHYYDKELQPQVRQFSGLTARMIQHEYDHIQGVLYLNYLGPTQLKKMKKKLSDLRQGKFEQKYPMLIVP